MALETGTYIDSLNASNPTATDALAQADDHLRLIKSTIKATLPNVSGAVTPTHTELNYLDITTLGTSEASKALTADASGNILIPDSDIIKIGSGGSDLTLYHDSNNSYITNGTGALNVATTASGIAVNIGHTTSETTINDNLTVTGNLSVSGTNNIVSFTSGMVMPYAGASAPTGWLLCDGSEVSASTYADLKTVVTTTYGSYTDGSGGTGTSHFRIPDLRGRVIAGQDDMGGASANRLTSPIDGDTLGASGGSESHQLTIAEMPSHTHSYSAGTASVSSVASTGVSTAPVSQTTGATGGGGSHNNVQPTIILNYIIKT